MKSALVSLVLVLGLGVAGLWAQQDNAASTPAPTMIVPHLVKFSGALTDLTGKPLSGPVEVTFSIYQNEADAEPLWQETQTVEADATGHYTVLLGAMSAQGLPMELFTSGGARWLGVVPGKLAEQPRVLFVSVPYALEAGDAATLGGRPASAYLLAPQEQSGLGMTPATAESSTADAGSAVGTAVTRAKGRKPNVSTGSANYIPMYNDASLDLGNSVMYQSSGNIGVGTTNPQAPVHVYSSGSTNTTLPGFLFQRPDTNAKTHFQHYYPGISYVSQNMYRDVGGLWYLDGTGSAGMAMILSTQPGIEPPNINFLTLPTGGATSPTKVMVIQSSGNVGIGTPTPLTPLQVHPATNANLGIDSQSGEARLGAFNDAGTTNVPMRFQASTFKFFNAQGALQALTIDPSGNVGIQRPTPGFPLDVAGNMNVVASASGAKALSVQATDTTAANTGISGLADGPGGAGIEGEADNGGTAAGVWGISSGGVAGLFSGNVEVTGTLAAGTKEFKIDDPLDPANKFLYHASVESSEMKTFYDGSVTLDANGEALVQLPEWFEAVNGDFRYQLTCVGGYAPVYIAQKIANHTFKIAGGTPSLEVDWQVTGVRHDAYAQSHPLNVEVEKPAQERGYYLHPELFDQPPEKSLEWADHSAQMQSMKRVKRAGGKATN
jgi:hypothetical protein